MFKKGDFHIHSIASDGELRPWEVVQLAKERGVDIIALTDHNTTLGVGEAIKAGKEFEITVIPGVELSTRFNNERIHILGYFKDMGFTSEVFQKALKLIKDHRIKNAQSFLKKTVNLEIDMDDKSGRLSVLSGIRFLRFFGAVVVLAHPVLISKDYLTEIINMPFDGIEARYCKNTDEDTEFFLKLAKEMGKFYTAGSDFHTNRTRDLKHGLIGDTFLNSEEIDIFLSKSGLIEALSTYRNFFSYNYNSDKYERILRNMYYGYRQVATINSYIRLLHASFNTPAVDIYSNGNLIAQNFTYKQLSPYIALPSGTYVIEIYPVGERITPIVRENLIMPENMIFNVTITGTYPNISLYPIPEPVAAQRFGRPCVRFINLAPNSPAVDIALPDETVIFKNLGYKEFTEYACILEGRYGFFIRNAGAENVIINTPNIQLEPNNYYAVYILKAGEEDSTLQAIPVTEPRQ